MKNIIRTIYITLVGLFFLSLPLHAEESNKGSEFEQKRQTEKEKCLVVANNCENKSEQSQQIIDSNKG